MLNNKLEIQIQILIKNEGCNTIFNKIHKEFEGEIVGSWIIYRILSDFSDLYEFFIFIFITPHEFKHLKMLALMTKKQTKKLLPVQH